jgi:hypothetical protein
MRTKVALGLVGLIAAAGLAGCSLFQFQQRAAWRDAAEARCLAAGLVKPTAFIRPMREIDSPGVCGLVHPFKVRALADGTIGLSPGATLGCPMMPPLEAWLRTVVEPAAMAAFGQPVTELKILASYGCRPRNNRAGARISEHAFGNAIDIGGFRLADGREVTVLRGWGGAPEEQTFLRATAAGACTYFSTVLGPGVPLHSNHFHLDLAYQNPRRPRHYCHPSPAQLGTPMAFAAPGAAHDTLPPPVAHRHLERAETPSLGAWLGLTR